MAKIRKRFKVKPGVMEPSIQRNLNYSAFDGMVFTISNGKEGMIVELSGQDIANLLVGDVRVILEGEYGQDDLSCE